MYSKKMRFPSSPLVAVSTVQRCQLHSTFPKRIVCKPPRSIGVWRCPYSQKPLYKIALSPQPSSSQKKWNQLSTPQKIARTTATGGNLLIIVAGMALTFAVVTLLYHEVLAPDSKTNWFNRAVARVKSDDQCLQLLGKKSSIRAYGEPTSDRWTRNRPIASTIKVDKYGVEHFLIHFNVEGDIDKGRVHMHLLKRPGQSEYYYKYLYLDVKGQHRVYLENSDEKSTTPEHRKKSYFGVSWR